LAAIVSGSLVVENALSYLGTECGCAYARGDKVRLPRHDDKQNQGFLSSTITHALSNALPGLKCRRFQLVAPCKFLGSPPSFIHQVFRTVSSSVVFLLHIALEIPIAVQGVWSPTQLPFLQLNNTTLVVLKVCC